MKKKVVEMEYMNFSNNKNNNNTTNNNAMMIQLYQNQKNI